MRSRATHVQSSCLSSDWSGGVPGSGERVHCPSPYRRTWLHGMDVRLCTMCAYRTGQTASQPAVPDDVTAKTSERLPCLLASISGLESLDCPSTLPSMLQRRVHPSIPAWGGAHGCSIAGRDPWRSRTRCRARFLLFTCLEELGNRTLLARWDQTNLMPTCQLMFKRPLTHKLLHY